MDIGSVRLSIGGEKQQQQVAETWWGKDRHVRAVGICEGSFGVGIGGGSAEGGDVEGGRVVKGTGQSTLDSGCDSGT